MAMDKDIRAAIRRTVESNGDIVVLGLNQLPKTLSYEEDPAGGPDIVNRMPEYRGDLNRGRFNLKGEVYDGNDMDADELDDDVRKAPVNVDRLSIPTSTSNPSRPRTLAAGYYLYVGERAKEYADQRGTLTVMFRDGTFYNYYNVPPGTWQEFKSSISKGPMLNRRNKFQGSDGILLAYPHGPANISEVPEQLQRYVYRAARSAQLASAAKYKRNIKVGDRAVRTTYVPTSKQKQVRYSKGRAKADTSRGKNPYQK